MRILQVVFVLLLCITLAVTAYADDDITMVSPEEAYPREVVDLELWINRADVTKITFELDYGSDGLKMQKLIVIDESAWEYDTDVVGHVFRRLDAGTEQAQAVFRFQFRLRSVNPGDRVWVSFTNIVLWTEDTSWRVSDILWEPTVIEPVSTDNCLSQLRLSDCAISPQFSPNQLNYTAMVSHQVAQVSVTAVPRSSGALVEVDSPVLEYGKTSNVTVTVTAEDGSVRVYTIAVTREDDPNRIPSKNCDLESLEVTDYKLSPAFHPDITDYVLWLPYETTNVEIVATPADSNAGVTVAGNSGFKAGEDNPIVVTCTAEDGTQKLYIITAKRAEPYIPQNTETTAMAASSVPAAEAGAVYTAAEDVPAWVYIVASVSAAAGCAAVGILVTGRKK